MPPDKDAGARSAGDPSAGEAEQQRAAGGRSTITLPRPIETAERTLLCPLCSCGFPECRPADGPRRVRMTRRMPWRHLAPDAVIVDRRRGSRWGNPHIVGKPCPVCPGRVHIRAEAVALCRWWLYSTPGLLDHARAKLAGRDLACWCLLDQECHADVLLAAVNGGAL
jgi:Domain of unknown function (DUF4326)